MACATPRRLSRLIALVGVVGCSALPLAAAEGGDAAQAGGTIQHVTLKDGRILDGILHDDGSFTLYDLKTGKVLATLQVGADAVVSSVDEPLVDAGGDTAPAQPASGATAPVTAGEHGAGLGGRWSVYFQPALGSAKRTGRPLLLLFTDSTSQSGKVFASTVLDDAGFKAWSSGYTVLFQTDAAYTQKKPPNAILVKQDDDLAKRFGVHDRPLVVMVNAAGKELARQAFTHGQADGFMADLQGKLAADFSGSATAATAAAPAVASAHADPATATAATPDPAPSPAAPPPPPSAPAVVVHRDPEPTPPSTPPPAPPQAPVPTAGGAPPPLGGSNGTVDNLRAWRDASKPKPDDN
jgi:hypothetical protein